MLRKEVSVAEFQHDLTGDNYVETSIFSDMSKVVFEPVVSGPDHVR
jgi:hypothetical protein